jgi:hypothetical protein
MGLLAGCLGAGDSPRRKEIHVKRFLAVALAAGVLGGVLVSPASAAHKCAENPSGTHQTNGNARNGAAQSGNTSWTNSGDGLATADQNSDTITSCPAGT